MALNGRYHIQKVLQDGLYGPILKCEDSSNAQHPVAVKIVSLLDHHRRPSYHTKIGNRKHADHHPRPNHAGNNCDHQAMQERHVIEILQSTCGHPNVLTFHHIYEETGAIHVIVMEFCACGDLQKLIEQHPSRRFPESQALQFFAQIVAGVQFLHANDIAHRDLSLENVLVTDQNVCKIGDFGLSVHSTLTSHEMVGKRFYMAPEVAFGEEYDPQLADLWSLGVILFIMLTGLPLVDFGSRCLRTEGEETKAFEQLPNRHQDEVNAVTLEIIKRDGACKLLELWGLDDIVSLTSQTLLDGLLQVVPRQRLAPQAILEELQLQEHQVQDSIYGPGSCEETRANYCDPQNNRQLTLGDEGGVGGATAFGLPMAFQH